MFAGNIKSIFVANEFSPNVLIISDLYSEAINSKSTIAQKNMTIKNIVFAKREDSSFSAFKCFKKTLYSSFKSFSSFSTLLSVAIV